jgi:hypothetical protein
MKFILYNDLRNNLILCMFYEVLGCVIALREFVQLAEQLMALRGLGHIVCVQL